MKNIPSKSSERWSSSKRLTAGHFSPSCEVFFAVHKELIRAAAEPLAGQAEEEPCGAGIVFKAHLVAAGLDCLEDLIATKEHGQALRSSVAERGRSPFACLLGYNKVLAQGVV